MFFNFKKPDHYDLKAYIWMFIVALNLIIMVLEEPLAELGYRGWAFWLVNISFFLMEEPNIKKKLLSICIGAIVGCLLAYGTITLYASVLMPVTGHLGLIIPVAISLALVILVGPFMPVFFNTVTFLYFVCRRRVQCWSQHLLCNSRHHHHKLRLPAAHLSVQKGQSLQGRQVCGLS